MAHMITRKLNVNIHKINNKASISNALHRSVDTVVILVQPTVIILELCSHFSPKHTRINRSQYYMQCVYKSRPTSEWRAVGENHETEQADN